MKRGWLLMVPHRPRRVTSFAIANGASVDFLRHIPITKSRGGADEAKVWNPLAPWQEAEEKKTPARAGMIQYSSQPKVLCVQLSPRAIAPGVPVLRVI